MPSTVINKFETRYLHIMDQAGDLDKSLMPPISDEDILFLYERMILLRVFNQRALNMQREGRIGTYVSILGQEAVEVGSAFAIRDSDWIFPSFRETGVYIVMGYPLWMLFRYWAGDERGMKCPENINIFPVSVPVGTQITHAVGAALAAKLKGDKTCAITYFGDGASSRGDFHEGLNLAGTFKLPVVFICQNNQWAISLPRDKQTASETIAQKAYGYGFEGIQVDGNDLFAIYKATKEALEKARAGDGPTLIEAYTYRLDDHTTADDASRYRSDGEVAEWKNKDPFIRYREYLKKQSSWSDQYEHEITKKAEELVAKAIEQEEAVEPAIPADMILNTYEGVTVRQLREAIDLGWQK